MCRAMGTRYEICLECCSHRQWSLFRHYDCHVRWLGICGRLWELWPLALIVRDRCLLGLPVRHDDNSTSQSMACSDGDLRNLIHCICKGTSTTSTRLQADDIWGATLVSYAAMFPRLARYMPNVRKAREGDLKDGKIDQAEYDKIESVELNHISNIYTAHSNIGYLLTLVINLSVLLTL